MAGRGTLGRARDPSVDTWRTRSGETVKFDFDGVTFSDGTTGEIYAASKQTGNGSMFTVCTYVDSEVQFLGQFGSPDFFSTDADAVRQFCLDHFADRTV